MDAEAVIDNWSDIESDRSEESDVSSEEGEESDQSVEESEESSADEEDTPHSWREVPGTGKWVSMGRKSINKASNACSKNAMYKYYNYLHVASTYIIIQVI